MENKVTDHFIEYILKKSSISLKKDPTVQGLQATYRVSLWDLETSLSRSTAKATAAS